MNKLKGFTLIEILVVIAIITLLMAILLPVTQRVRNQARAVFCQANLRQWGTVFHMYTEDNQGRFFPSINENGIWFIRGSYIRSNEPNIPPVVNNMNTQGIVCCPMATKTRSSFTWGARIMVGSGSYNIEGKQGSTFGAWEITSPPPSFHGSYGYNRLLLSSFFFEKHNKIWKGVEISSIKSKSNVPVFFDCAFPSEGIPSETINPPLMSDASFLFINRHYGFINVLFADWSVRKIGLKGLYTLKWDMKFNTSGPWTTAGGVQPEDWPEWMQGFKDY